MRVACVGDVMLDVLVETLGEHGGLVADDDIPARISFAAGGQASNVAAWVSALGGTACVCGPRASGGHGVLAAEGLARWGIELSGPEVPRPGAVLSLVSAGTRSMASDPGDAWVDQVRPGPWLEGADWLFVSGYALLRAGDPAALGRTVRAARSAGARIAVDLASASMIEAYGAAGFRDVWQSWRPDVVFATEAEWAATNAGPGTAQPSGFGAGGTSVLVLKQGPAGATFVIDGVADERPRAPGPVVDATGAGDALAAGFLVGGADLAMRAAAQCVARLGAQPEVAG